MRIQTKRKHPRVMDHDVTFLCDICQQELHEFVWMVHDHVWLQAMSKKDHAHLGCFETKLGRQLTLADFKDVPANSGILFGYILGERAATAGA